MDLQTLYRQVESYNESEVIYKKYHELAGNPGALQMFLKTLNPEWLKDAHLLLPELSDIVATVFLEEWIFAGKVEHNAVIQKHNRYTPAYLHLHDFWEIIYVLQGQCSHAICQKNLIMQKGDICFVPPGTEHSLEVLDDTLVLNIILRRSRFEKLFFNFMQTSNPLSSFFVRHLKASSQQEYLLFHTEDDIEIRKSIMEIYLEYVNDDELCSECVTLSLQLLFIRLIREFSVHSESARIRPIGFLQHYDLILYIKENYATVTLGSMAEHFHFTPEYTSKLVRSLTGRTFMQILHDTKVEKACMLLADTSMPVHAIAGAVGYVNPESFIRVFKRAIQMTPSEYRKGHYQQ